MRITATAPEALIYDCNQYAMCLAFGPADGETYGPLNWQDADGNLYSAASWEARPEWIDFAQAPLVRPEWDVDEIIDMVAAERAQAVLVYSTEALLASPAALTAIGGMSGPEALAAMGLSVVPESAPED
jgi:hypothetical protein